MQAVPGLTHFVSGLGTTGTFMGTGRRLKELNSSIHLTSITLEVSTEEAYTMIRRAYEQEEFIADLYSEVIHKLFT